MEEKKSTYKGSSDAMRKAIAKYQAEKVEDIKVRVPKGQKEYYKRASDLSGLSLNQFIINAMDEKIQIDVLHID